MVGLAVGGCSLLVGSRQPTALLGDSITDQSRDTFEETLGDGHRLDIRAAPGVRTDEWIDEARRAAAARPDAVIVNLGTNDVFQATPIDESTAAMDSILTELGQVPCTFVVTVNESLVSGPGDDLPARAAAINAAWRRLADAHGVEVIDWSATVAAELAAGEPDGSVTSDTVHPTPYGERLLAGLYDEALADCDPDVGAPEP